MKNILLILTIITITLVGCDKCVTCTTTTISKDLRTNTIDTVSAFTYYCGSTKDIRDMERNGTVSSISKNYDTKTITTCRR